MNSTCAGHERQPRTFTQQTLSLWVTCECGRTPKLRGRGFKGTCKVVYQLQFCTDGRRSHPWGGCACFDASFYPPAFFPIERTIYKTRDIGYHVPMIFVMHMYTLETRVTWFNSAFMNNIFGIIPAGSGV